MQYFINKPTKKASDKRGLKFGSVDVIVTLE